MELRAVRGMKDILPDQAARWQWLERTFRGVVERYGFGEVRTPLLEATELFVREIGESTDVVEKEMYSFERHDDRLTVRPEGTAGATRAYVQHSVSAEEPITRWYYMGPMFRAERPAKGRYRQFHQCGCEIYGDPGPLCDAELIDMCAEVVRALGIDDFVIHLSSLGAGGTRQRYKSALHDYFLPHRAALSEDSRRRLDTNPLRILDSKSQQDQQFCAGAPSVLELLDEQDRAHFESVRRYLDALGVEHVVEPRLVRGLDYYTRTLFELKTTSGALGAQDALLGGGRYDGMVESLGGKRPVPAIGFAMGIERVLALSPHVEKPLRPAAYVAPIIDDAHGVALGLAKELRKSGLSCEVDGRAASIKAKLRRANTLGCPVAVLIGADELERGEVTVKDLERHEQQCVPRGDAVSRLRERLGARVGTGG